MWCVFRLPLPPQQISPRLNKPASAAAGNNRVSPNQSPRKTETVEVEISAGL